MKQHSPIRKQRRTLGTPQILALGFLAIILLGTLLLCLPISSSARTFTSPIDAGFTAVSATCVTGLITLDTATHWSTFGHVVILLLIQVGGLGFMTMAVLFSLIVKRAITPKERMIIAMSYNLTSYNRLTPLIKRIIIGTLSIESVGACLLAIRLIPQFGVRIDNNLSSTKRTAQIVVKNEDLTKDNKVTLRIEQKGFVFDASCYYDIKFDALPSGKSYKINYESSADLKITKPSWIKCDDNGDGVIIVTAEDNINNAPRSGSIELSNSYTSDTKSFNVSQKEYEFSHSGSDSYSLESKSKSDIYIDITSTGSWSASSDASWLRVSPKSGKGNGTITVFAEENTEKQSRSSTVSIICKDNSDMKYQIVFNQKASSEK